MNEVEFNDNIDELYTTIEDAIDDLEADVDCEISGGVLTLQCPDGSALIFSRQSASKELWLAARSGGFHYSWQNNEWYCARTEQTLSEMLAEISKEQVGEVLLLK
ncbi:iron donor protein CyaY [Zhongshania sp.]|jgi:CyaY protein|uniref:iron donor protein CyaY n=1 Tax=Zhongshania sp. TaxID=1971902 RepID=UPI001B78AA8C|nr:iron donor protein CyaY [Zhongshania sp.]MBQ0795768.1 iron donor protein CyaY [Zhongshania sp.]|tara:strand:- start:39 stop:353 length:315 start_codon:yes stop_codon:yes gene_type:complete